MTGWILNASHNFNYNQQTNRLHELLPRLALVVSLLRDHFRRGVDLLVLGPVGGRVRGDDLADLARRLRLVEALVVEYGLLRVLLVVLRLDLVQLVGSFRRCV